ncbi:chromosomal replication initiation protein [Streptococcus pyogenes]|nr:chromosomal replication initiation protein [Streptococcus pyogenes]
MTENEQIFWNRVLELAQSQLKQATYEFFVHDARLLKVDKHIATIYLDQMKELFWEKILKMLFLLLVLKFITLKFLLTMFSKKT